MPPLASPFVERTAAHAAECARVQAHLRRENAHRDTGEHTYDYARPTVLAIVPEPDAFGRLLDVAATLPDTGAPLVLAVAHPEDPARVAIVALRRLPSRRVYRVGRDRLDPEYAARIPARTRALVAEGVELSAARLCAKMEARENTLLDRDAEQVHPLTTEEAEELRALQAELCGPAFRAVYQTPSPAEVAA